MSSSGIRLLRRIDSMMRWENRSIIILIDASSARALSYKPTNIRIEQIQSCFAPHVLPLRNGAIRCFKLHYRRLFYSRAIDLGEAGDPDIYQFHHVEAIQMAQSAWKEVSVDTLEMCWKHERIHRYAAFLIEDLFCDPRSCRSRQVEKAEEDLKVVVSDLMSKQFIRKEVPSVKDLVDLPEESMEVIGEECRVDQVVHLNINDVADTLESRSDFCCDYIQGIERLCITILDHYSCSRMLTKLRMLRARIWNVCCFRLNSDTPSAYHDQNQSSLQSSMEQRRIAAILSAYPLCDQWTLDITTLSPFATPNWLRPTKGANRTVMEHVPSGDVAEKWKEDYQMEIGLACNAEGNERMPLLSAFLLVLGGCSEESLKSAIEDASITRAILDECVTIISAVFDFLSVPVRFLEHMDLKMYWQNRYIVLLVDRSLASKLSYKPHRIRLLVVEPHLASQVLPLRNGPIRCLNTLYRQSYYCRAVVLSKAGSSDLYEFSLVEVLKMVQSAWEELSANTILTSWKILHNNEYVAIITVILLADHFFHRIEKAFQDCSQLQRAEDDLEKNVLDLMAWNRIHGDTPTIENLVNPVEEGTEGEESANDAHIAIDASSKALTHGRPMQGNSDANKGWMKCKGIEGFAACVLPHEISLDVVRILREVRARFYKKAKRDSTWCSMEERWREKLGEELDELEKEQEALEEASSELGEANLSVKKRKRKIELNNKIEKLRDEIKYFGGSCRDNNSHMDPATTPMQTLPSNQTQMNEPNGHHVGYPMEIGNIVQATSGQPSSNIHPQGTSSKQSMNTFTHGHSEGTAFEGTSFTSFTQPFQQPYSLPQVLPQPLPPHVQTYPPYYDPQSQAPFLNDSYMRGT